MSKRFIGLFDSGVGGLSILKDLQQRFPNENFVYLADQNNYPYGVKTSNQLKEIVGKAANHLLKYNVKAIVIACNTASAHSDHLKFNIPIHTIIKPICLEAKSLNIKNILLIATEATVKSGLYKKCLSDKNIQLFEYPAPNFVNLVESFNYLKKDSVNNVKEELNSFLNENVEGIILGCTHFNFLKPHLTEIFPNAKLIDGLNKLSKSLEINLTNEKGYTKLLTTGNLEDFTNQAQGLKINYNEITKVTI